MAIRLDGVDDYMNVSNAKILASLQNSSVSAWINTNSTGGASGRAIYCERASAGNDIWKLELQDTAGGKPGSKLLFTHRDDGGALTQTSGGTTINDGKWHHVGITKSVKTIILYVDGVSDNTATLVGTDTMTNTIRSTIGGDFGDGASRWSGPLTEVSIFNRTLSPVEMSILGKSGVKQIPLQFNSASSCKGYWPLDYFPNGASVSATSGSIIDRSGSGNNGIALNVPIALAEQVLSYV